MGKQTTKNNTAIGMVMENGLAKTIIPSPRNYFTEKQISLRSSENETEPDVFKLNTNNKFPYKMKNGPWGATQFKVMDVIGTVLRYRLKNVSDIINFKRNSMPTIKRYTTDIGEWREQLKPTENLFHCPAKPVSESALNTYTKEVGSRERGITITEKEFKKLFVGSCPSFDHILHYLNTTAQPEFKLNMPVKVHKEEDNKIATKEIHYYVGEYSRLFNFAYEPIAKCKEDGRKIYIFFNTLLGRIYFNNILARNYSIIKPGFYKLPDTAQLLYRKFISYHSFPVEPKELSEIKRELSLNNKDDSALIQTICKSLECLKENKFIKSYKLDIKEKYVPKPMCYIERV